MAGDMKGSCPLLAGTPCDHSYPVLGWQGPPSHTWASYLHVRAAQRMSRQGTGGMLRAACCGGAPGGLTTYMANVQSVAVTPFWKMTAGRQAGQRARWG